MTALYELSIEEAARKLASREISSVELTDSCLARIEATDAEVGSFLEVTHDVAKAQAAEQGTEAPAAAETEPETNTPVVKSDWDKTPRNSPCPCGSGKKFKQCHAQ